MSSKHLNKLQDWSLSKWRQVRTETVGLWSPQSVVLSVFSQTSGHVVSCPMKRESRSPVRSRTAQTHGVQSILALLMKHESRARAVF